MKGSIDKVTSEGSVGWLFAEPHGRKPLVQAFLHHRLVGQAVADLYRPDLEQVGLGDGRHGFEIRFEEAVDPIYLPFLSVRPEGFDLTIPANGQSRFLDLIGQVMTDSPGAGRHRSVLGGLWTDRVDAPSVLAGRVSVGSVGVETRPVLSDLIAFGYAVIRDAMTGHAFTSRELGLVETISLARRSGPEPRDTLASLAEILFRDRVIDLLRAIFDDHPVAYRLDVLTDANLDLAQACAVETLSSPAECALLYLCAGEGARVEIVRDSHELAEFSEAGRSRWTPRGASAVRDIVTTQGASLEAVELAPSDVLLVGPGTIHRVVAQESCPVLRMLSAPRRVTPTRFLSGEECWLESTHASGARLRL